MLQRISRDKVILLVCDIQNKFAPKTYGYEGFIQISEAMVKTANVFKIPIIVTQQNKKVFGDTQEKLKKHLKPTIQCYEKEKFSMIIPQVQNILKNLQQRTQIILIGMEAQICVLQTFLDLKQRKYTVYVPADAVTSTKSFERTIGLKRLEQQGAIISSYQSLTFELLQSSKDQHFKQILDIIKLLSKKNVISHL